MAAADFISVIESVIKAMKNFITQLENSSKSIAQTLQEYSTMVAGRIRTQMISIFNSVERSIKNEISGLTTRLEALGRGLKKSKLKSGTSIMQRLESLMKTALADVEKTMKNFTEIVERFITKFQRSLELIANSAKQIAEETFTDAEKFAGDVVQKIQAIGKDAMEGLDKVGQSVSKEFSHIEKYAFDHEIRVAEQSALSFIDPFMVIAVVISAGIIIGAGNYTPK